jgi:hypothetical protein
MEDFEVAAPARKRKMIFLRKSQLNLKKLQGRQCRVEVNNPIRWERLPPGSSTE